MLSLCDPSIILIWFLTETQSFQTLSPAILPDICISIYSHPSSICTYKISRRQFLRHCQATCCPTRMDIHPTCSISTRSRGPGPQPAYQRIRLPFQPGRVDICNKAIRRAAILPLLLLHFHMEKTGCYYKQPAENNVLYEIILYHIHIRNPVHKERYAICLLIRVKNGGHDMFSIVYECLHTEPVQNNP